MNTDITALRADRDTGCALFGSCLRCPLPACLYDLDETPAEALRELRGRIVRMLWRRGWSAAMIAERLAYSRRGVYRDIGGTRPGPRRARVEPSPASGPRPCCEQCETPLLLSQRRFCSRACRAASRRVYKVCAYCGGEYRGQGSRCCSRSCARRLEMRAAQAA